MSKITDARWNVHMARINWDAAKGGEEESLYAHLLTVAVKELEDAYEAERRARVDQYYEELGSTAWSVTF